MKGESAVATGKKGAERDIEKVYSKERFAAKLRRLADCIEQGKRFQIQVSGEKLSIPTNASISIEHERGASEEELEFQIKWPVKGKTE